MSNRLPVLLPPLPPGPPPSRPPPRPPSLTDAEMREYEKRQGALFAKSVKPATQCELMTGLYKYPALVGSGLIHRVKSKKGSVKSGRYEGKNFFCRRSPTLKKVFPGANKPTLNKYFAADPTSPTFIDAIQAMRLPEPKKKAAPKKKKKAMKALSRAQAMAAGKAAAATDVATAATAVASQDTRIANEAADNAEMALLLAELATDEAARAKQTATDSVTAASRINDAAVVLTNEALADGTKKNPFRTKAQALAHYKEFGNYTKTHYTPRGSTRSKLAVDSVGDAKAKAKAKK